MKRRAKSLVRSIFRATASFPWSRRLLNAVYLTLSPSQRALFHGVFAKTFRDSGIRGREGTWKVKFGGKTILMPLSSDSFWLDWDNAVSIVGHDIEVKQTYETLIGSSDEKPELFIDVGANYGTHSLLFLAHGVKTITFEPNSSCHECFRQICRLNDVVPRLEPMALGEREAYVDLSFPKRETWLGSTKSEVVRRLGVSGGLITETVEQKTLDDYLSEMEYKRTLIKLDTEGNELSVLKGADKVLRTSRPKVVFECLSEAEKPEMFDLLDAHRYRIFALPWSPEQDSTPLDFRIFTASSSMNFIAVPAAGEPR